MKKRVLKPIAGSRARIQNPVEPWLGAVHSGWAEGAEVYDKMSVAEALQQAVQRPANGPTTSGSGR